MERYPVSSLQTCEVTQDGGELVNPDIKLLIGNMLDTLTLRLWNEVDRCLVLIVLEMSIDAIIRGIEFTTDKPFPKRRIACIQCLLPILIPVQHVRILFEALWKVLHAEPFINGFIRHVCLGNELRRRIVIALLLPVDRDLRF